MVCVPGMNIHNPNSLHSQLHQTCKDVCLYRPISPFVMPSYKLLRAFRKSMEHHLVGNGFCFLWYTLALGEIGLQTKMCIKKKSSYSKSEEWLFFFSWYPGKEMLPTTI